VISSISFSNRLDEDYAPDTWQTRFFLLDGWLGLLYLAVFCAIAFLWRPTPHNRRLAMSDELATEEEDFEVGTLDRRRMDDDAHDYQEADGESFPMKAARRGGVGEDEVVFDIGEEDDEAETPKRSKARDSGEVTRDSGERERLFGDDGEGQPPRYA
jgi:flagellar biosynthesis/type III secretory pathway M-ring protein FliF/YscJ